MYTCYSHSSGNKWSSLRCVLCLPYSGCTLCTCCCVPCWWSAVPPWCHLLSVGQSRLLWICAVLLHSSPTPAWWSRRNEEVAHAQLQMICGKSIDVQESVSTRLTFLLLVNHCNSYGSLKERTARTSSFFTSCNNKRKTVIFFKCLNSQGLWRN